VTTTDARWLVLLRHAKAADPHGVPDRDRPLAGKGRRNAHAAQEWFAAEGPHPDLAITSDAVRARQTWELVRSAWPEREIPIRVEPRLYGADPLDLLAVVHQILEDVRVAVVVGHEPILSATALLLASARSDPVAIARLRQKFPTNGVVVMRFAGRWGGLVAGGATLETFVVPRPGERIS
jgi:phosphohistidine phosphatase